MVLYMEDKKIKTKVVRPKFDNDLDTIELSSENIIDMLLDSELDNSLKVDLYLDYLNTLLDR